MRVMRLTGVVVLMGMIAGCQTGRSDSGVTAPPANANVLQSIRQTYQLSNPNVLVGLVVGTRAEDQLAAVEQLPVDQLKNGQAVVFVDSTAEPISNGTIVNITNGIVVVKYNANQPGHRAPQGGDLMVRFQ